ncbi:hypothetical protein SH139x_002492 [Planctomycetaceae bacterium SH139]
MPGKAAKVTISENQQAILQTFVKARSSTVSLAQRSRIILLAYEGHNNESIEELVGPHHDAVGRWRSRWREARGYTTLPPRKASLDVGC